MYTIVRIDKARLFMLPHPQQPMDVFGRVVPAFDGKEWRVTEIQNESVASVTYPNEAFDPSEYIDNPRQAAFLVLENEACVGSVRVCKRWNGGGFIDDIAIDRAHRGHGLGMRLMNEAVRWCGENGLYGVSLETQDWNVAACRFYMKYGFTLGGIDTRVYAKPPYRGAIALYFYLEGEAYQQRLQSLNA